MATIDILRDKLLSRDVTVLPQQSLDLSTYPTSGLQIFALFIVIFFPVISVTVVGLRIYDRVTSRTFSLDDVFIVGATVLAAVEAIFSFAMIKVMYIGLHVWQLPTTPYDPTVGNIINYIVVILYNPELGLVKSSVLFFLLRLGGQQPYLRRLIQILNLSNIALLVAVLFASIFTCVPIQKYWDRTIEGHCNEEALQYIITSSITVVTDILVLIIPIKIVIALQMPRKLKIILVCLLCAGVIVTIFSILRLYGIARLYYPSGPLEGDWSYDISFVYSTIECNLAIITASIPALHGLMRKWFPRFLNSSYPRNQNVPYSFWTIGGSGMPLKEINSGSRPRVRRSSLTNSEEEILGADRITRTTLVQVTHEDRQ